MKSNAAKLIAIAFAAALITLGCDSPVNGNNGNDHGPYGPIVETETIIDNGEIRFTIPAGLVRQGQLAAITALINGLDVSDFEDYVTGVSFAGIPNPFVIELVGGEEDPQETKSTITLRPNITAQQMQDAFDSARDFVRDAREGNIEPAPIHVITQNYLPFYIHGNATQAEIDAFRDAILALPAGHVSWVRPYIERWTLVPSLPDGNIRTFEMIDNEWSLHGQRGVFLSTGELELQHDLTMARAEIRAELGLDDNGNPTYVERESTDGSGNTIRFEGSGDNAADLFAALRTEAEALTDEQINRYAAHIDTVIQLPAGAWGDEGRWVMYEPGQGWTLFRDGTHPLTEDLTYAYDYITNENGNDPFHTFTDAAGNELSFFAEEGFDYTAALAWLTHPGNQAMLGDMSVYVASLTLKHDVDGNRQIRLNEEDPPRAVVISDGSESVEEDLEWGQIVGMGLLPPTHALMQAIRAQMANAR